MQSFERVAMEKQPTKIAFWWIGHTLSRENQEEPLQKYINASQIINLISD